MTPPSTAKMPASPAPSSVSVSVSFSAVHGRSGEAQGGIHSGDRPPMHAGERPRPRPPGPPTLRSVRAAAGNARAAQAHQTGRGAPGNHGECRLARRGGRPTVHPGLRPHRPQTLAASRVDGALPRAAPSSDSCPSSRGLQNPRHLRKFVSLGPGPWQLCPPAPTSRDESSGDRGSVSSSRSRATPTLSDSPRSEGTCPTTWSCLNWELKSADGSLTTQPTIARSRSGVDGRSGRSLGECPTACFLPCTQPRSPAGASSTTPSPC